METTDNNINSLVIDESVTSSADTTTATTSSSECTFVQQSSTTTQCEYKQELMEIKMCKVCSGDTQETVFIPCGHIVACLNCAKTLKKCPFCREVISNLVEIFFV